MWPEGWERLIGMGCMRLSTEPDRDERRSIETLHTALDAGVNFFDTADAYCLDSTETGHNERLLAAALAGWSGDRSRILIGTKGGLTRPNGQWVPDGRARHLAAACDASLRALGLGRLPLYQLHVPDPRVPLATSVRALDALRQKGYVDAIGLCNVTVGELEEARQLTEIAAVQIELSPWTDDAILSGLVAYCARHGIRVLAHRPLGGVKRAARMLKEPAFAEPARRLDRSPADIALAWVSGLSHVVTPLPGATRLDTARAAASAPMLTLTDEEWTRLASRFPSTGLVRQGLGVARAASRHGEIVLIIGLPAAGKSTMARTFTERGYARLNRDERGGPLRKLLPALERTLDAGASRVVLDNTYASRASRGAVIQWAAQQGLPVRCVWMTAGLDDAQVNAATRMIRKYGRLLEPDEIRVASRRDPNTFAPNVLFRFHREFEPPDVSEGFSAIDAVEFSRERVSAHVNRALFLWCDGVLTRSRSGRRVPMSIEDLDVSIVRRPLLERYAADGYRIIALSWQPEIDEGSFTRLQVDDIFRRVVEQMGVPMDVLYCPHPAGPPVCWCRSPLPGLGVLAIERYGLDPASSLCVGQGAQNPLFARKLGIAYRDVTGFFEVNL